MDTHVHVLEIEVTVTFGRLLQPNMLLHQQCVAPHDCKVYLSPLVQFQICSCILGEVYHNLETILLLKSKRLFCLWWMVGNLELHNRPQESPCKQDCKLLPLFTLWWHQIVWCILNFTTIGSKISGNKGEQCLNCNRCLWNSAASRWMEGPNSSKGVERRASIGCNSVPNAVTCIFISPWHYC
jgi:hypothetical protein